VIELFLADIETAPCEVIPFVIEHERVQALEAGPSYTIFLRSTATSARFLDGRLYQTFYRPAPGRPAAYESGFHSELALLVRTDQEATATTTLGGGDVVNEKIMPGGLFFETRRRAEIRCAEEEALRRRDAPGDSI
jgi:hypothetical protein